MRRRTATSSGTSAEPVPPIVERIECGLAALAPVVVAGAWAVMIAVPLACIVLFGRNIPLAEDWLLVAPLTGNEPDLAAWAWAQNNEHRMPLSRLLLLGVLVLFRDFRAGMVLDVALLAAVSAALMLMARRLRGGRTRFADAFFPVALLHLGNWPNLVWAWQMQFVTSVTLVLVLLLQVVRAPGAPSRPSAAVVLGSTVLLCFTGASGLVFAMALAPWALLAAWHARENGDRKSATLFLLAALFVPVFTAAYFTDYHNAYWNPPSPSHAATLWTSLKFLAVAFGTAAERSWTPYVAIIVVLLGGTLGVLLQALLRADRAERVRAFGLLCFAGGVATLALAIGWGRAGEQGPMHMRYVLFSVPSLIASYFIWELYGRQTVRARAPLALFLFFCVLLPSNTMDGLDWGRWYVGGMRAVENDLREGMPTETLVQRHQQFLLHWDREGLEQRIRMLRDTRFGPFALPYHTLDR